MTDHGWVMVHGLQGCLEKVTDRSQSVPTRGGWKALRALFHCTAATGVQRGCAAPHTCTDSFTWTPGLAVAV